MSKQLNPFIEYFSKFQEIPNSSNIFEQFNDCTFITQLLSTIRNFPNPQINPYPKTFSHRFSNLKELYTKLKQYWKNQLNLDPSSDEISLIEIASHKNMQQIKKLLQLILKTGIQSSKKQYFIEKMLLCSPQTQNHFMNLIDKALNQSNVESPRKQRERQLQDQIIIYEQQNDGLCEIIREYQNMIMELQQKNLSNEERMKVQEGEIEKLSYKLAEVTQTPQKKKHVDYLDTNQKNVQYIEKLKDKIMNMAKSNEQQVLGYKEQIDYLSCKVQKMNWLQNQLQLYKIKVQSNKQAIQQYDQLNQKSASMKRTLIQKTETITQYSRKLQNKNIKIQSLQDKIIELQLQLERKNVQLAQLGQSPKYNFDDSSNFFSTTMNRTLSEQCPQVINNQTQHLSEINKELRGQLQRSIKTLRQTQGKLEKLKKESQKLQVYGQQNRKLTQMLNQVSEQTEQQKGLILGALYEIRTKYIKEVGPQQKTLKNQTKRNLSRTIKKF